MVLVQDENEVQEVLPATLTLESGEGYDVEEFSHQELKSTLGRLPVETLKLLCNGEGLSEAGVKRDLVERLAGRVVSKSKRKERIDDDGQDAKTQDWGNSDLQFLALERSLEKSIQVSLEKAVGAFFPNGPGEMGGMASNPMAHWSMPGQQYFQQPGQPGFVPGGIFTYRSMLPYPSAY
ncbi:4629_t:CDS:2 [Gigaspora rosea]|nr:4629_t:CDS:2 [Gigaspora rosea]